MVEPKEVVTAVTHTGLVDLLLVVELALLASLVAELAFSNFSFGLRNLKKYIGLFYII